MFLTLALTISFALSPPPPGIDATSYLQLRDQGISGTDRKTALEKLEQAVKMYDQDGDLMYSYAQTLLNQERYEDALKAYDRAEKLGAFNPKFKANIQYDRACAYAKLGRIEPAYEALNKAVDLGFRDLTHLRTDADLNALHSDKRWENLSASADVTKMSRDEAWRYDLWFMNREVTRIHINPYRTTSKETIDAYIKKLHNDIPKLSDNQITAAFVRYMVMMGDGHTGFRPHRGPVKIIPIQVYQFEEGIYITGAAPSNKDLAGAELLEVEGRRVAKILALLPDYVHRDNSMTLKTAVSRLTVPSFLNGIGMADSDDELTIKIKGQSGQTREVTLKVQEGMPTPDWALARDKASPPLYFKDQQKAYWYEYLPAEKTVYFQYNSVRNQGEESIAKFAEKMFKFIEDNDVEALVVDCRWNGGGNSFLNRPLTHGILKSKVNKAGGLYVVIGRQTFSACQNFVTDLERETAAIFVGEPSGSSPNFVGESIPLNLPYSKMVGSISDLYWQRSWPMDNRNWIAPDLPAPPSFEAFRKNIDPSFEAIRNYRKTMASK